MLAKYQSSPGRAITLEDQRKKREQESRHAVQFKNILAQPVGKMWFPSLGYAGGTSTVQTIPQKKKPEGKAQLNPRIAAQVQERAKSQQKVSRPI